MKINHEKNINSLKKAFYKGRVTGFKKLIVIMSVFGILASIAYFIKYAYVEYAVSRVHIVLNYPEIAKSQYPDGSRFTYYDFICDENLEGALDVMQQRGKYMNFTVDDIRDKFYTYSYLVDSADASVSTQRSEGNDFSYVANEYKITFVQPRDYTGFNLKTILFQPDLSGEFLEALIEVNRKKIARELSGVKGFNTITATLDNSGYDYAEEVSIYKTKINSIMSYLKSLEKKNPDFVSEKHSMSINDLRGHYSFLVSNSLDGINDFVESSGISKDVSQVNNKMSVNIENNRLKYNKESSRAFVNRFAMENYDQTFTENLINVIQNNEYGLYQARPKTAFDSVVAAKHLSDENVAEYGTKIYVFEKELDIYKNVMTTPEEHKRLTGKCEELLSKFRADYDKLTLTAKEVVTEYYNKTNENYLAAKITPRGLVSKAFIIKLGIAFAIGAMFAFVMAIFFSSMADRARVKRKKKLINKIKNNVARKGV